MGSVLINTAEELGNYHSDPLECRHCHNVLADTPDAPADATVIEMGLRCAFHHKLDQYNESELRRKNGASNSKDASDSASNSKDASDGASSSKRPRGLGGSAGGSSAGAPTLDTSPPLVDPLAARVSKKSVGPVVISSDEEEEAGPAVPEKRARKNSPIVISTDEEEAAGSEEQGTESDDEQVVAPAKIRGVSSFKLRIRCS